MTGEAIKASGVSKKYCRSIRQTMLYGMADLARTFLGLNHHSERLRDGEFWSVDGVDFELKQGETLGLIGPNGAGKSTLLRMLNGIILPDKGEIEIAGRVGALIEIGAGFHPMLTGRENIYVCGAILGMSRKELDKKLDEILDFADIGEFIDSPVKHYSSGMYVRLGFAVAIHAAPDILLVDEVLAVGDANFQKKCFEKILDLKKNGTAIILVSHSVSAIERLCGECLLLMHGKLVSKGPAREVIQRYFSEISRDNLARPSLLSRPQAVGTGDVVFSDILVYQEGGDRANPSIEFGKNIVIEFGYRFNNKESDRNQIRLNIRTFEGRDVQKIFVQESSFGDGTAYPNEKIIPLKKEGTIKVTILGPRLMPQAFRLDVGAAPLDKDVHLGGIANAAMFNIVPSSSEKRYFEYGNMTVTEFDYAVSAD